MNLRRQSEPQLKKRLFFKTKSTSPLKMRVQHIQESTRANSTRKSILLKNMKKDEEMIESFYLSQREREKGMTRFIAKPWEVSNQIDIYDIETMNFSQIKLKDLPHRDFPFESASVIHNDVLHFSGGNYRQSKQSSYECFVVDLRSGQVRTRPSLSQRRQCHCMVYIKGLVSISGQQDSKQYLIRSVEYLAPSSRQWVFLPFVNKARFEAAACSLKNQFIYLFGGVYDDSIQILDLEERKNGWSLFSLKEKCKDWQGFICAAACSLNDKEILVFGDIIGENRNFIIRPEQWERDIQQGDENSGMEVVITKIVPSMEGYRYPCVERDGVVYTMSVEGVLKFEQKQWKKLSFNIN